MKKLHWTYSEFDRTYFLSYQIIMINDRKYTENIYNIYIQQLVSQYLMMGEAMYKRV